MVIISRQGTLSFESKAHIGGLGTATIQTTLGCAVVATAALLVSGYLAAVKLVGVEVALAVYLILSFIMVVFASQIWKMHTSSQALSRRRAYYDREIRSF